ncbi:unnamed protein product [Microthlaspi erraticum]|uniref:Uncharacterized protein n=1 Tax=Microthlaspi erraticum TaxID=1685480 RepID=A0A6D2HX56_9BRAS|nr:unnamed protein product [Microthlaspi erraticum]
MKCESDDDEEEQEFEKMMMIIMKKASLMVYRNQEPQQPMENQPSVPIEIPTHNRRSRQHGNRGGRTTNRGRNQSSRQTTQTPRRRAVMDTHLTNIESYLATMQTPIQMLNARSQANEDYERESWLQLNELQGIEKFTDFWWASSEILRDPFEQKSPWKRQLSGSSGPSSRGSFGSGSGSPGVGGFSQFSNAGNFNIGGTSNFGR